MLLLLCTVLVIGVARRSRCTLIFFSVSGLFCIIICWLLAGVYLASSVAAGDFCMRPHDYMCRQVGMVGIDTCFPLKRILSAIISSAILREVPMLIF